jgi:SAC3 family protein LENG8/THP3
MAGKPFFQSSYLNYRSHLATAPSYTPVIAQRTLGLTHTMPSAQQVSPPEPSKKKTIWPPAIRDYVQRTFAAENDIPGIGRQEVESMLKEIINDAARRDELETTNWEGLPLPQQLIQNRQVQRVGVVKQSLPHPTSMMNPLTKPMIQPTKSPKKRKSNDGDAADDDQKVPPWQKKPQTLSLSDRMTRDVPPAEKRQRKTQDQTQMKGSKYQTDLEKRKKRFQNEAARYESPTGRSSSEEPDRIGPVVGTSQQIEKRYLRLTAPPKPETVRPLAVLAKTLEHLKMKWKTGSDYTWVCDQFKSLRQDLTVQHIKNEFTVSVYEIHARIALQKGDLGEYNQCQTQLKALYKQGLGGHPAEFLAYRILYLLYTCNRSDMNDVLASLTEAEKSEPAVRHALEVRSARALGNYHKFFKLFLEAPYMGAYLMDMFVPRERLAALANICKA